MTYAIGSDLNVSTILLGITSINYHPSIDGPLHVADNGFSIGYLFDPVATVAIAIAAPIIILNTMAPGKSPHFEMTESGGRIYPSFRTASITANTL